MTRNQTAITVSLLGLAVLLGGILIGDERATTGAHSSKIAPSVLESEPSSQVPPGRSTTNRLERLPPVVRVAFESSDFPAFDERSVTGRGESDRNRSLQSRYADPVHWLDGPDSNHALARLVPSQGEFQRQPAALPSPVADRRFRQHLAGQTDGELVTLHLNEVSVRQALETLSRSHGLNILVAPGVAGTVTANIEGMDVGRALDAILKLSGHVAHREDGLIYVYAEAELPREDFRVRVFPLDFVSAIDVLPVVSNLLSTNGLATSSTVDPADNTKAREAIVVTDRREVMPRVEEFIQQVDIPPMQVMIEAHVLQVDLSDDLRHGINYKQAMNAVGSGIEFEVADFADPMASPAVFARIAGAKVDGLLHFLKTNTDAKTLASPRLMVINGQKARIQVGERLPYKIRTVTETATVEEVQFLEVGVVLEVTPRISRDGRVMMRVKPEVSDGTFTGGADSLPGEETRELESDVLLEDGQGVVIGGLIQEKDIEIQTKVPFLGDMHWIGRLFQKRSVVKERTEIVITLVPRICTHATGPTARDLIDAERSQTPLFTGPLYRLPRPWEPRLPDAVSNPQKLWGHGVCLRCGRQVCICGLDHRGHNHYEVYDGHAPSSVAPPPVAPVPDPVSPADILLPAPQARAAGRPPGPPPVIIDPVSVNRALNTRHDGVRSPGWPPAVAPASAEAVLAGQTRNAQSSQLYAPVLPAAHQQPTSVDNGPNRPFEPPPLRVSTSASTPLRFGPPLTPVARDDRADDASYLPLPHDWR